MDLPINIVRSCNRYYQDRRGCRWSRNLGIHFHLARRFYHSTFQLTVHLTNLLNRFYQYSGESGLIWLCIILYSGVMPCLTAFKSLEVDASLSHKQNTVETVKFAFVHVETILVNTISVENNKISRSVCKCHRRLTGEQIQVTQPIHYRIQDKLRRDRKVHH